MSRYEAMKGIIMKKIEIQWVTLISLTPHKAQEAEVHITLT